MAGFIVHDMMANMTKKSAISMENVYKLMFSMNEKVDTLATLMEIQNRRADRSEKSMGSLDSRLKRSQTQTEKYISAFQEQMNEIQGLVKRVFDMIIITA